jgi:3-methyladenine DNA glycosylase AlkD
MKVPEALARLESLGTAQNRKVYARHGVRGAMFGVSYAELGKLAKQWKGEHELALGLWASGNHDARVLATMIAAPDRMTARELDAWVRDVDAYVLADALARLSAQSPAAAQLTDKWIASKSEWIATSGWNTLAWRLHAGEAIPVAELRARLGAIEAGIQRAKNRVRYAMNGALIGIGVASRELRAEALAAAGRIGPVAVDHGETGCKTPDAAAYIGKVLAHRSKKKPAKKTRKTPAKR